MRFGSGVELGMTPENAPVAMLGSVFGSRFLEGIFIPETGSSEITVVAVIVAMMTAVTTREEECIMVGVYRGKARAKEKLGIGVYSCCLFTLFLID